jgi:hypothetical protein
LAGQQKRENIGGFMPFCSKCGTEVPEDVKFSTKCGNTLQKEEKSSKIATEATQNIFGDHIGPPDFSNLSNKWAWTLACVPIFGMILSAIIAHIGYNSELLSVVIFIVLNITFITLDIKELEKNAFKPDGWLWLGVLLVPVYLFVRASKTNKKYGYAITWCVLFVLSSILEG